MFDVMNNKKKFIEKTFKMNINLDSEKVNKFEEFMNHMLLWNERVRLTSITDENEIIDKHFIDSLTVVNTKLFDGHKKVMDMGTGGGFPGIPLKFYNDEIELTMIDSRLKKIEYLETVIEKFNLKNTFALHGRAEDYGRDNEYREKFDVVVSRAVAELATLAEFCLPFVSVNGYFVAMKGSEVEDELNDANKAISILGGKVEKIMKFQLPDSDFSRSIIVIKKVELTPKSYPRTSGKPKKKPIKG